ncbi:MAG: OmpL47-type beta-barrel domain-containing protein [Coriobacteriia bacterium]
MSRPRSRTLRAMVAIALCLAVTFAIFPAAYVAAIAGGYYPVRISPDVAGSFAAPVGIALAPSGDVYVADTSNSRVKRMSSAGAVLSVWGSRGMAAGQFREPEGVVVLSTGRVVVADTDNNRLQLFEADGTYVATWGSAGSGPGQLSAPCGLAVDASNNVYVADAANGRIQKFSSAGVYLATIGSQGPGNGQLDNPRGVAVDSSGLIYVADTNNKRIQKFSAAGGYLAQWGLKEVSGWTYSRYSTPYSLAIDSTGNLLIADSAGMKYVPEDPSSAKYYVERCSLTGTILSQWGAPGTAPGQFAGAMGVTKRSGGGAYVTDGGNNRVQVLSATGTADAVWSGKGSGPGELDSPQGLAVDAGDNVYVADTGNDRIQAFNPSGGYVSAWGSTGSAVGFLDDPTDVSIDASGNVWVVERANSRVQSFTSTGTPLSVIGSGLLSAPEGIALDPDGNVYVADTGGARVRKFSPAGTLLLTVTGDATYPLYQPTDVALDAAGSLYVSDRQGARVRVYDNAGAYLRTIGMPGSNAGEFTQPSGVVVTGGYLFVVDSGNNRIQRFTTAGSFETTFGAQGAALGEMSGPWRGAVDSLGRIIVTERDNHRMQVWAYDGVAPTSSYTGFVNFGTYSTPVTMTISATDGGSGVAQTYYRVNAGSYAPYTAPLVFSADGTYVVRFYSVDRIGNVEAERQARVTIDMTGPAGTFVLAGGASHVATTGVSSALSFTDPNSVIDMRFDTGSGYGGWESYTTSRDFTLGEGTHTVFAQLRDSLNNVSTHSDTVTVDLTAPSTEATDVPPGWTNQPVSVRLLATDGASGVADTFYRVGEGPVQGYATPFEISVEGETVVSFRSVDAVGNAEETSTVTVRIDTQPPAGTMALAAGAAYVATTTVSVDSDVTDAVDMRIDTGSGYGGWMTYAATHELTMLEGGHAVAVEYRDRADNRLVLQGQVYVDLSAPVTTISGIPDGWTSAAATVTLDVDDAGAGTERTYYRLGIADAIEYSGAFVIDTEGITQVTYWSVDKLGWIEQERTAVLSLDVTDPSAVATVSPAGWYSGSVTVTIQASDTVGASPDVSGVESVYYRLGAGVPQLYSGAFQVTNEGETTVWYWAVDTAGNIGAESSVMTRVDTVRPSGSMAIAGGQAIIATTSPTIDSDVPDALEMRIDTGSGFGEWMIYTTQTRVTLVGAGEHTVTVEYRDRADNRLQLLDDVYLDLTAPVTVETGIPTGWSSQPVTVTLTPADADSSVAATYYRTDSGTGWSGVTEYGDPFVVDAEGETGLEFWSVDSLGNVEATRTATIRIDSVPATPTSPPVITSGRDWVDLHWDIHPESDVTTYTVSRRAPGDEQWSTVAVLGTDDAGESGFTYHDSGLTKHATYEYRTSVEDAVGNESAASVAASVTVGVSDRRLYGQDRYQTALAITSASFDTADTAVLATGASFADALGASSLAGALNAPILITPPDSLPPGLLDELERLGVQRVVIIGSERAISANVARQLSGFTLDRLAGVDRYETAAVVASQTLGIRGDTGLPNRVFIVRGDTFADALAASPVAYANRLPVLLVRTTSVPASTRAVLAGMSAPQAVVVGGVAAISDPVAASLLIPVERVQGADRYATAAAVASWAVREDLAHARFAALATGAAFPDALTGGAAMGALNGTVLLTAPTTLPSATSAWFTTNAGTLETVTVLGGESAVTARVVDAVRGLLR